MCTTSGASTHRGWEVEQMHHTCSSAARAEMQALPKGMKAEPGPLVGPPFLGPPRVA